MVVCVCGWWGVGCEELENFFCLLFFGDDEGGVHLRENTKWDKRGSRGVTKKESDRLQKRLCFLYFVF